MKIYLEDKEIESSFTKAVSLTMPIKNGCKSDLMRPGEKTIKVWAYLRIEKDGSKGMYCYHRRLK